MRDALQPDPTEHGPRGAEAPVDDTLGGYFGRHHRPPAFEGLDGHPYTVSLEVEKTPDLRAPFSGYLVFPRWAETGAGIVGHLETPLLFHGRSRDQVMADLEALTLLDVDNYLRAAVRHRQKETE